MINLSTSDILKFIANNYLGNSHLDYKHREGILERVPKITMKNEKKGIPTVLDAENIVFYVGPGVIGYTSALIVKWLSSHQLTNSMMVTYLEEHQIQFELLPPNLRFDSVIRTQYFYFYFVEHQANEIFLENIIFIKYGREDFIIQLLQS